MVGGGPSIIQIIVNEVINVHKNKVLVLYSKMDGELQNKRI